MRVFRFHYAVPVLAVAMLFVLCGIFSGTGFSPAASAQSTLAGDIVGTVTDPSGAAVSGATVKAINKENGGKNTATTSATGGYRFSLLKPGSYVIEVSAPSFKATSVTVNVTIGQIITQNLHLSLGAASETVHVDANAQLLQTDDAQLNTEINLEQLQAVPNPGGDITYAAQTAPGVVMNTGANAGSSMTGYGNFSVFGLPGTSNNFTMNGMQVNDPFLNLNNSGPSNLLLGLNDVAEVNVVTNAYAVQYGSFGGAQINSITRGGSDKFHGNAEWDWNGRSLNANDWFVKRQGDARPFSNDNQWAAAVGGPVIKNKTFFFFNTEGVSFITSSQNTLELPSSAWETSVVGADGKCDNASSSLYTNNKNVISSQCAFYNNMFKVYNGTANYANAKAVAGGDPDELQLVVPSKFNLLERMITARVDENISENDRMFIHFKYDHGVQPSYTDPINSAFSAQSDQPDYEGQMAETHTFGSKASNQFLVTGSWYGALFVAKNPALEASTFPFQMLSYDGFLSTLDNNGLAWPEGRNVTQYQLADDFSYNLGKHTLKAGFAFKKDDVSDHDTGEFSTPLVYVTKASLAEGQALLGVQNTTTNTDLPLSLYTLGFYVQDDWKPMDNLTITGGIRLERNSNPACTKNCLSNFGGDFFTLAASSPLNSASGAYNAQIKSGLNKAFTNYQAFMLEPRLGFNWSPSVGSKTVVSGGVGIFTDVFPGTIADTMLNNAPLTTSFTMLGDALAPGNGLPVLALNPASASSAQSLIATANSVLENGFAKGGSFNSMLAADSNFSAPNFTTVAANLHYPTYEEWNLRIQRAITKSDSLQVGYVGNHGFHEPNQNVGVNAAAGIFGVPANAPAPSFGSVNEIQSEAASNYNGLIVAVRHQGHGLTAQVNYAWSHSLDEISNGGILPFNGGSITTQINPYNLHGNYGNSDYDIRQYFSGNYLYVMPHFGGPKMATGGWQISGTVYYDSGNPFTPMAYVSDWGVNNYDQGSGYAPIAAAHGTPHHCGPSSAKTACLTSANFPHYTNVSPFGQTERNQFYGPHYFDTDMTIQKAFDLRQLGEASKLQIGATFFNLLNHPSFVNPTSLIDSATFGSSTYAEGPPTSIYGAGMGGDDSVRVIQFTTKLTF